MSETETHAAGEPLSAHVREEIDRWLQKFPADRKRSAVISALHAVMHEKGWLPTESMDAVAAYLGIPPVQVYEAATFYSMFETRPTARHHISVCTNISCMLCGGESILDDVIDEVGQLAFGQRVGGHRQAHDGSRVGVRLHHAGLVVHVVG